MVTSHLSPVTCHLVKQEVSWLHIVTGPPSPATCLQPSQSLARHVLLLLMHGLHSQNLHSQNLHSQDLHSQVLHSQVLHSQDLHSQDLHSQTLHRQVLHSQGQLFNPGVTAVRTNNNNINNTAALFSVMFGLNGDCMQTVRMKVLMMLLHCGYRTLCLINTDCSLTPNTQIWSHLLILHILLSTHIMLLLYICCVDVTH